MNMELRTQIRRDRSTCGHRSDATVVVDDDVTRVRFRACLVCVMEYLLKKSTVDAPMVSAEPL